MRGVFRGSQAAKKTSRLCARENDVYAPNHPSIKAEKRWCHSDTHQFPWGKLWRSIMTTIDHLHRPQTCTTRHKWLNREALAALPQPCAFCLSRSTPCTHYSRLFGICTNAGWYTRPQEHVYAIYLTRNPFHRPRVATLNLSACTCRIQFRVGYSRFTACSSAMAITLQQSNTQRCSSSLRFEEQDCHMSQVEVNKVLRL